METKSTWYNCKFQIKNLKLYYLFYFTLDHDVFQLITWSKDQSLRVWRVDSNLQKLCGFEPDNEPPTVYEPESDSLFVNQNSK